MRSCDGADIAPAQEPKLFIPKSVLRKRVPSMTNLNATPTSAPLTRSLLPTTTKPQKVSRSSPARLSPALRSPQRPRRRIPHPLAQQITGLDSTSPSASNMAPSSSSSTPLPPSAQHNSVSAPASPQASEQVVTQPVVEAVDDEFGDEIPAVDQADRDCFDALNSTQQPLPSSPKSSDAQYDDKIPSSGKKILPNSVSAGSHNASCSTSTFTGIQYPSGSVNQPGVDDAAMDTFDVGNNVAHHAESWQNTEEMTSAARASNAFISGTGTEGDTMEDTPATSDAEANIGGVQVYQPQDYRDSNGWLKSESDEVERSMDEELAKEMAEERARQVVSPQLPKITKGEATFTAPEAHQEMSPFVSPTKRSPYVIESEAGLNSPMPQLIPGEQVDMAMSDERTQPIPQPEDPSPQHEHYQSVSQVTVSPVNAGDQDHAMNFPVFPPKESISSRRRARALKNSKVNHHRLITRLSIKRGEEIKALKTQHKVEMSNLVSEAKDKIAGLEKSLETTIDEAKSIYDKETEELKQEIQTLNNTNSNLSETNTKLRADLAETKKKEEAAKTSDKQTQISVQEVNRSNERIELLESKLTQAERNIQLLKEEQGERPSFRDFINNLEKVFEAVSAPINAPGQVVPSNGPTVDWEIHFNRLKKDIYKNARPRPANLRWYPSLFQDGFQNQERVELNNELNDLRAREYASSTIIWEGNWRASVESGNLRIQLEAQEERNKLLDKLLEDNKNALYHLYSKITTQSSKIIELTNHIVDSKDSANILELKNKVNRLKSANEADERDFARERDEKTRHEQKLEDAIKKAKMGSVFSNYQNRRWDFIPDAANLICDLRAKLSQYENGTTAQPIQTAQANWHNTASVNNTVRPAEPAPSTPPQVHQSAAHTGNRRGQQQIPEPLQMPMAGTEPLQSVELSPSSKRNGAEDTVESPNSKKSKTSHSEPDKATYAESRTTTSHRHFEPTEIETEVIMIDPEDPETVVSHTAEHSAAIEPQISEPFLQQGPEIPKAQNVPRGRSWREKALLKKMRIRSHFEADAVEPPRQRPLSGVERWRQKQAINSQSQGILQTSSPVATTETVSAESQEETQRSLRSHKPLPKAANPAKSAMRVAGAPPKEVQRVQFCAKKNVQVYTPEGYPSNLRHPSEHSSGNQPYRRNHEQVRARGSAAAPHKSLAEPISPDFQASRKTLYQPRRAAEELEGDREKLARLAAKNARLRELANYKPFSAQVASPKVPRSLAKATPDKATPNATPKKTSPPKDPRRYIIEQIEALYPETPGSFPQEYPEVPYMSGALSVGWNEINNTELEKVFAYHPDDDDNEQMTKISEREAQAERSRDVVRRLFTPFGWVARSLWCR